LLVVEVVEVVTQALSKLELTPDQAAVQVEC
jgi:hypothetical protein